MERAVVQYLVQEGISTEKQQKNENKKDGEEMKYVLVAKWQRRNEIITNQEKDLRALRGKSNNRKPG